MSASTRKQQKSLAGLKREGRGLGFFGDDNDKIRSHEQKQQMDKNMKVQQ
jgi:hypothetical protein